MQVCKKVVAITGAAGGLGSNMVQMFAHNGATVWLLDLDYKKCETVADELSKQGFNAYAIYLDVACEQDWITAVNTIIKDSGRIDVLINNAGINIRKTIEEMSMDEWMKMLQVNIGGVFIGIKTVLPYMREQHNGLIINMSSMCGLIGHKFTQEAYTATKGAVTMLTKSIASRYGSEGIRCNSIHPCTVDTPLLASVISDPIRYRQRIDEVPLGRLATKEDVSYAALYLASEEASFLNGIALPVDGGVTCY